jgi:hypothetical protein
LSVRRWRRRRDQVWLALHLSLHALSSLHNCLTL